MVWGKAGSTTLTSAGDDVDITSLAESTNRMIMSHMINSGACQNKVTFNDTGSSKYATRNEYNDDADSTQINQNFIPHWDGNDNASNDQFVVSFLSDIDGEEKLGLYWGIDRGTAGANTIRSRNMVYKYINTPKITSLDLNNQGAGSYDTGSNITALGSDVTPAPSTPAVPAIPALLPALQTTGGWVELARTTWSSGNSFTVSSIPDKRYLMVLNYTDSASNYNNIMRFNSDTSLIYAWRRSQNGESPDGTTKINTNSIASNGVGYDDFGFSVNYIANLSNKEKLTINHACDTGGVGSTVAPDRQEVVGKWTNTTDSIDEITITTASANYNLGETVVLGWDPADIHTTNFWEELASVELGSAGDNLSSGTFTAKKYLWFQVFAKASGQLNIDGTFNNDTGSNYSARSSRDGTSDGTSVSQTKCNYFTSETTNQFINGFIINNSANEKLVISHLVVQNTAGAGTAPRREENVFKWANTSSQITELDFDNVGTGSFDTGSIIKVWGSN
jgi:hypothetical protein